MQNLKYFQGMDTFVNILKIIKFFRVKILTKTWREYISYKTCDYLMNNTKN